HQAVSSAPEDIQPRTPRYDDPDLLGIAVEEALEEVLPLCILVQLVNHHHRRLRPGPIQLELSGERGGAAQNLALILEDVPAEVNITFPPAGRGLSHLPRPADESHLAILAEMFPKDLIIEAGKGLHSAILSMIIE